MRRLALIFSILCLSAWSAVSVQASPKTKRQPAAFGEPLARRLVRRGVAEFVKDPFFAKQELPVKVAVGLFELRFETPKFTARDLTNDVLNSALEQGAMLVVNDNPQLGEGFGSQLEKYEDDRTLRYHAAMLGAESYITGALSEKQWESKPGKFKAGYFLEIRLKNVRSDQTDAAMGIQFSQNGKPILPKKPRQKTGYFRTKSRR